MNVDKTRTIPGSEKKDLITHGSIIRSIGIAMSLMAQFFKLHRQNVGPDKPAHDWSAPQNFERRDSDSGVNCWTTSGISANIISLFRIASCINNPMSQVKKKN